MTRFALALDIGATKLAAGVVDESGALVAAMREPTRRDDGPDAVIARLLELGAWVAGSTPIDAVGVACGGPLDTRSGVLLGPLHLPGWDHVEIVRIVEQRFARPAVLVNDASAGAWGEFRAGAAREAGSMVYITVSSGMGGGAVLDGRLLAGATTNGGEFGHICVRPGGRRCTCGRLGCVEAYIAGTQLAGRAREALEDGAVSALSDLPEITGEAIAGLVGRDDLATRLWEEGVDCLAQAVVDLVNVLEPEVVVLGGGVTKAGELLFRPVRERVAGEAMRPVRRIVQVRAAALSGGAPAVGAGLLALARPIAHGGTS